MDNLEVYLSGKKLYGDDFDQDALEAWYADEEDGYANLGSDDRATYKYGYHALNWRHGFRHLGARTFSSVLGIGSAYGDELLPIVDRISKLTILDPADAFSRDQVYGTPCSYVKPTADGLLSFDDESFELIVCLGVLHHIANVSLVLKEMHRCLAKGGILLLREPIVSLGDWSKPRQGLTKRERGIPLSLFGNMIDTVGFSTQYQSLCVFPLIPRLWNRIGAAAYNNRAATYLDAICCRLLKWNIRYHPKHFLHKFRPSSVFFVLTK
jgi:ubiquinone/menaquinone biosynthesis C-methylase UbiE